MTALGELDDSVTNTDLSIFRANISVAPTSANSPAAVVITNSSILPGGVNFSLDYGDGSATVTNSQATFNKTYANAGEYNIVLTLTDSNMELRYTQIRLQLQLLKHQPLILQLALML